ncbi:potassium transporter Kup [Parachitinimonas caeni]|uniref:Probable potassium transport system protein Kup n=1 Tax=Parachitinimonas caeni TaxID=3031301 RepID=A0ABT7DXV0_9NEIS|nr:potassium transporter Kup [Parachitinimonas caeni]MDK2124865.1 potassium transporter Kup [Parachitinimonas caeni]
MSQSNQADHKSVAGLILGAIGVVYGDIGTSPLYTLKECFNPEHGLQLTPANVLGILSLVFWALILIVSFKYVMVIMRADNRGEGGILALMALALRKQGRRRGQFSIFIVLGIAGAALFYGDGMITPAISVLSAVEGLELASTKVHPFILPIAIAVLVGLFMMQAHGTAAVGKLFGPIMVLWFLVLAILGVVNILHDPTILAAINPVYAIRFFLDHHYAAFLALGSVVLAITGGEAIYADMGHFGRRPIRLGWFAFVLPALLINYFGQGALLLHDASARVNPFYHMAPDWALVPLVILATAATVIASQAVISGAFSITAQAIQLGYCPRMDIQHTSDKEIGQIYLPGINWALLVSVIVLVLGFRSSNNLAAAYGIAVTGTMVITTALAYIVLVHGDGWKRYAMWLILTALLIIELAFFASNAMKFFDGGWFPLLIGIAAFVLMTTWKTGRRLLFHRLHDGEMPLESFVDAIEASPPHKVEGTAIFMTGSADTVPHALLHNLKHNKVLHENVMFLTIQSTDIPVVGKKDRLQIKQLSPTFWQVVATYGFNEEPSVPEIIEQCLQETSMPLDMMTTSFFLSRETIVDGKTPAMSWLRRRLFATMQRNAARPTDYFKIPPNRVVEMGTQVEI